MKFKTFTDYAREVSSVVDFTRFKLWYREAYEVELCRLILGGSSCSESSVSILNDFNSYHSRIESDGISPYCRGLNWRMYKGIKQRYPDVSLIELLEIRLVWLIFYALIAYFLYWCYQSSMDRREVILIFVAVYPVLMGLNLFVLDIKSPVGFISVDAFVSRHSPEDFDIKSLDGMPDLERVSALARAEYAYYLQKTPNSVTDMEVS